MLAKACILLIERICQQRGPFALGEITLHPVQAGIGLVHPVLSGIEQVQVIQGFVQIFVVSIVVCQPDEMFLR